MQGKVGWSNHPWRRRTQSGVWRHRRCRNATGLLGPAVSSQTPFGKRGLQQEAAAAELRITRGCSGIGSYALHLNCKSLINKGTGVQRQGTDCCHFVKPLPVVRYPLHAVRRCSRFCLLCDYSFAPAKTNDFKNSFA